MEHEEEPPQSILPGYGFYETWDTHEEPTLPGGINLLSEKDCFSVIQAKTKINNLQNWSNYSCLIATDRGISPVPCFVPSTNTSWRSGKVIEKNCCKEENNHSDIVDED